MKKLFLSITCSFFVLLSFALTAPTQAEAESQTPDSRITSEYIEALEDGSYFRVTILEDVIPSISRSTQTKTGSKYTTYYDSDGTVLWKFTVYGTFQYTPGANAACTSISYTINIYDGSWENASASFTTNRNQAVGDATFKKKVLFITTNTENVHLVLSCDTYGNLS